MGSRVVDIYRSYIDCSSNVKESGVKTASRKQEDRYAKDYGGRRAPGSGNGVWVKNDVRTETESWELKTTSKMQYTLKHADLEKAEKHALIDGRAFRFGLEMCDRDWVLMSKEDHDEREARIRELETSLEVAQEELAEALRHEKRPWEYE